MHDDDLFMAAEQNDTDLSMDERKILPPITEGAEKKTRAPKKDRSQAKYSEADFRNLPRDVQHQLAEKYWNAPVAEFDDGTFQFSYTHFGKVCEELGFRKGIVDDRSDYKITEVESPTKIYIDHGTRPGTVERKFTLDKETADMIDALFAEGDGSKGKLANIEKSKIVDAIIRDKLSEMLEKKRNGTLTIAYRPVQEIRLI